MTGAAFSADERWLVGLHSWPAWKPVGPVPTWFLDLAAAIFGNDISDNGILTKRESVQAGPTTFPANRADLHAFVATAAGPRDAEGLQGLAEWLLADRQTRFVAHGLALKVSGSKRAPTPHDH